MVGVFFDNWNVVIISVPIDVDDDRNDEDGDKISNSNTAHVRQLMNYPNTISYGCTDLDQELQ